MLLDADALNDRAWNAFDLVRQRSPEIRYLVFTHTPQQYARVVEAGADRVLQDGFTTEVLFAMLPPLAVEAKRAHPRSESESLTPRG